MAEPKCKYFGKCGGCTAQHIDYNLQLENKKHVLGHALRNSSFEGEIKVFSGDSYSYRNRMDFIFTPTGLGFRKKGEWRNTVDIEFCKISNNELNKLLGEVRSFFVKENYDYFDLIKQKGTFRYAVIRTPSNNSSISFVLNKDSTKLEEATILIKKFSEITSARNIVITYVPKTTDMSISEDFYVIKGDGHLTTQLEDKTLEFSIQGFFQNNTSMGEKLVFYVKELLSKYNTNGAYLLDLYGGVGSFGIICSDLFRGITIVENFKGSIDSAKRNIELNKLRNAEAFVKDSKSINNIDLPKPLFVITDPPRSGMVPRAIERLLAKEPEVMIYVSCNLKQLGKELPKFKGYVIKSAAIFDLFPQTIHCEGVIELVKVK